MNRLAITKIAIHQKEYTAYIALNKQRDFIDFQLFEPEEHSLLDHIYIGRVDHVLPNIQAVFIRISPEQKCYLPLTEAVSAIFSKKQSANKIICEGDELLVQVTKEAVKTKDPVVSTHLTLMGSYAVLTTGNTTLSVSKKLPENLRKTRKERLEQLCPHHMEEGYGIILRTNSAQAADEDLQEDILTLVRQFHEIVEQSRHLAAFSELYRNPPGYIRRLQTIRNFSSGVKEEQVEVKKDGTGANTSLYHSYDGIYTDDPAIHSQIASALPYLTSQKLLHLYDDPQVSLSTLYNIPGNIDKLLAKKVWLPSGGNLIIESVEAMTVIDVNTAKHLKTPKGLSAKTQTFRKVNIEAAREIARQLRLRNISGIIIVDFINMEEKKAEQELVDCLKAELLKDTVPCKFVDITRLGLVELTRKKVHKSLAETLG